MTQIPEGLVKATLPRVFRLPVSGEEVRVRPPTVREAVAVFRALPGALEVRSTREILTGWLPDPVLQELRTLGAESADDFLVRLVYFGTGLLSAMNQSPGGPEYEPRVGWEAVLDRYCAHFRTERSEILDNPFPFVAVIAKGHGMLE